MPLAGPPLSDALLQRLKGICAEMRSDSFWRDLASPIQAALNALRDEAESFDSISAKEYRKSALQSLEGAATTRHWRVVEGHAGHAGAVRRPRRVVPAQAVERG